MPDKNSVKYIRGELAMGRTEDIFRPLLLNTGWAEKDIDDAFAFVKRQTQAGAGEQQAQQVSQKLVPATAPPASPVAPRSEKADQTPPAWMAKTRIGRGTYILLNLLVPAGLCGLAYLAYELVPNSDVFGLLLVPLSILYFVSFILLRRFRANDIAPETQINLAKKGMLGFANSWMLLLAPFRKEPESSFDETTKFYLQNKTSLLTKNIMVMVISWIVVGFIIAAALFAWLTKR